MSFSQSFFAAKFGLTTHDLQSYLNEAMSAGGDYADLYFEYLSTSSIGIDESIVKSATEGVTLGVGVRVISGERTGYAYSDDLSPEKIRKAAKVAALIAKGPASVGKTGLEEVRGHDLYPMLKAPHEMGLDERVALIKRADVAARAYDSRVFQVQASYADSVREVLVASSDGKLSFDRQPMARMGVAVLAREGGTGGSGVPQHGYSGGGGRVTLDFFLNEKTPEHFAREAARQAIVQLGAVDAPAGEMTVVLGPGWPGILLHEAVGHGLEADFNRKGVSAFSGRIGEKVASELCTVIDDGTIAGYGGGSRRGSLNVDDEGTPTQRNVLIENGVLRGYLQDTLSARLTKSQSTGSGRRESYHHIPMPRMTNTFMLAGQSDPEEIIRSVPKGLYCPSFSGGQVDITSGNFVFQATECYLIEGGHLGSPVKGASLIGNGPEALKYVSMVGNDLKLDEGMGICGKEGQSVPVGVGIPTVKIDRMTVGDGCVSEFVDVVQGAVKRAMELGATGAECTISEGEEFSASVRMREVENLKQAGSRGAGIRVLVGQHTGSSYTSDLSREGIESMVHAAVNLATITTGDPHAGLPEPEELGSIDGDLRLFDPAIGEMETEWKIAQAKRAEEAAFAADERIQNSDGASFDSNMGARYFATSAGLGRGFAGGYRTSSCGLSMVAVAKQNGSSSGSGNGSGMERDYWYTSSRSASGLETAEAVGRRAAERAVRRLNARKIATRKAPVLLEPRTARSLLGDLFDAVNGGAIYRHASFLAGKLGGKIASPALTVIDDPTMPGLFGTSPFDDEGVRSRRTVVIEGGVLKSYLLNSYTARKLGMKTTGNASRGITGNAGVGPGNFFIQAGERSEEEIIRGLREGLYVTELIGANANTVTGDYSAGAAGVWIENGELAYPVAEITIAGNLKQMLLDLDQAASNLEFRGSIAAPAILIGEMTISGH